MLNIVVIDFLSETKMISSSLSHTNPTRSANGIFLDLNLLLEAVKPVETSTSHINSICINVDLNAFQKWGHI